MPVPPPPHLRHQRLFLPVTCSASADRDYSAHLQGRSSAFLDHSAAVTLIAHPSGDAFAPARVDVWVGTQAHPRHSSPPNEGEGLLAICTLECGGLQAPAFFSTSIFGALLVNYPHIEQSHIFGHNFEPKLSTRMCFLCVSPFSFYPPPSGLSRFHW